MLPLVSVVSSGQSSSSSRHPVLITLTTLSGTSSNSIVSCCRLDRFHQPFANAFQRGPGIAESVEWAKALVSLDTLQLDPEVVQDTAGILFKQREDVAALLPLVDELLAPDAA